MGAVDALAPTVFEIVDASTHGFWKLFSRFHYKKDTENAILL